MAPRAAQSPAKPSANEVEDHELSHCPPRRGGVHCVKSQAKNFATSSSDCAARGLAPWRMYFFTLGDAVGDFGDDMLQLMAQYNEKRGGGGGT